MVPITKAPFRVPIFDPEPFSWPHAFLSFFGEPPATTTAMPRSRHRREKAASFQGWCSLRPRQRRELSRGDFHVRSFQGSFVSRKPPKILGKWLVIERTMAEQKGESTPGSLVAHPSPHEAKKGTPGRGMDFFLATRFPSSQTKEREREKETRATGLELTKDNWTAKASPGEAKRFSLHVLDP